MGGFIGPFAGQSIAVILPNVADTFSITLSQAALTMAVYLFPFATVMLFSNRLVAGLRPKSVIMVAYTATIIGAITCLLTPSWWLFLAGFMIMGISNAFTTPVLQVMLRQIVPADRLGASLGTYAAMQSLGLFSSPLCAGLATLLNWQYVYIIVLATAGWIVLVKVPEVPVMRNIGKEISGKVPVFPTVVHALHCFVIGFAVIGTSVLVAQHVGDHFGMGSVGRGIVVMCGGLASFILARSVGRVTDTWGPKHVLAVATIVAAVAVASVPLVPAVWLVGVLWALAIVSVQGMQLPINLTVLGAPGGNSLIATVQAFRFYGGAVTPAVMLPVYANSSVAAFAVPAITLVIALALQATSPVWKGSR